MHCAKLRLVSMHTDVGYIFHVFPIYGLNSCIDPSVRIEIEDTRFGAYCKISALQQMLHGLADSCSQSN